MRERVSLLVSDVDMMLVLEKFETIKEYPIRLHLREHILTLRMFDDGYHQFWSDNESKWRPYTL